MVTPTVSVRLRGSGSFDGRRSGDGHDGRGGNPGSPHGPSLLSGVTGGFGCGTHPAGVNPAFHGDAYRFRPLAGERVLRRPPERRWARRTRGEPRFPPRTLPPLGS